MKRTQIYFPVDLYQAIESEAKLQGESVSEVIRKTMQKNLETNRGKKFLLSELIHLAKPLKDGKHLSRDYKNVLYHESV